MGRTYLSFNSTQAYKDFANELIKLSNRLIKDFRAEAVDGLKYKENSKVELATLTENAYITSRAIFHARAILESYGKGSLMDKSNPYLDEYMQSEYWNPLRKGNVIVGRAEGEYIDFFGNPRKSKGKFAGQNVEQWAKPIAPKYTIQNAEKWFLQQHGRIERELTIVINNFISNMGKYFRNKK